MFQANANERKLFPVPSGDRIELLAQRCEKRKRCVQRGELAVEVEVNVVFFEEDPNEPCLEPSTVHGLAEIACKAEADDVESLQKVGRVFQAVTS